jgi:cyclic beta-1,2-glucan synthetase
VAFAAASPRATSWSGDRAQFLGRDGLVSRPEALGRIRLDNRTGANLDAAAALQVEVNILPGRTEEVIFLLGEAEGVTEVRELVARYQKGQAVEETLAATRGWWDARLGTIQVHTPVLSSDFLLNRWLPYQAISCRFWGRSALYQSSGAFGFRDQLQDAMAFVYVAPDLARRHILAAAARQFLEGDVQHWWHAETGNGVRTRCSDDLAWLPFVTNHYVRITGDHEILDTVVPFIEGEVLKPEEQERMFVPTVSGHTATLAEHCRRALDRAWTYGVHGLPLIGSCDWNDGLNHVGVEGRGESVWLAWFLCAAAEATRPRDVVAMAAAVEANAWDGDWYLRAFFDDGTPLGSKDNTEARIDSIAQSWAVLSGAGDRSRMRRALESAGCHLVDEQNRMVLLFTPPFDHSEPHPGYIMGYPPGLRENGGQYTHGSLWLAMAWARLGDGDTAVRLLNLMNPVEHSRDPKMVECYRGEPYVAAADVYAAPGRVGQAGWTWYTGSASWMYRAWLEEVLGFRLRGDTLELVPAIPAEWEGFNIRYRYRTSTYEIEVHRRTEDRLVVEVDGAPVDEGPVRLVDDGATHKVTVWLPQRSNTAPSPEPVVMSPVPVAR